MKLKIPLSEAVKEKITKSLANFLLSEKTCPEDILVSVTYPQSIARLHIDISDLKENFKEKEKSASHGNAERPGEEVPNQKTF